MNFLQLLEEQLRQQQPAFQPSYEGLLEPRPAATVSEYSPDTFTPNAEGLSLLSRVGLGFMPGAGVGDFLGQFPDAEGGLEPGALENWEMGNYGTTVLQSLGALGDVAMLVPGLGLLGAIAKAPRTAQRATRATQPIRTQYDEAMEVAQRNAALPVEQGGLGLPADNTAMDRARAMGFDTDAYHGTASDFRQIDPEMLGQSTGARSAREAFWATDDPRVARSYAEHSATDAKVKNLLDRAEQASRSGNERLYDDLVQQAENLEAQFARQYGQGQNIMPLRVRSDDLRQVDMQGRSFDSGAVSDEVLEAIRSATYDNLQGVAFGNFDDAIGLFNRPATHYAIADPTAIRSRFAAFDPAKRNLPDILAGIGATGIGLGLLSPMLEDERY